MGAVGRGCRNAFRNVTRTVAIVLIVAIAFALALVMAVSHTAASDRVQNVQSGFGTNVVVRPAGFFGFGGEGNALSAADVAKIAATPHVVAVVASVEDRLTNAAQQRAAGFRFGGAGGTTSLTSPLTLGSLGRHFAGGGFSGGGFGGFTPPAADTPAPVTVVGSTTPLDPTLLQATSVRLTRGVAVDGSGDARDADVGTTLAAKNHLTVGDTFTAYGTTIHVVGLFDASSTAANASFVVPLKTEQALSGIDGVTSVTATVDSLGHVAAVASAIQRTLGTSVANVASAETGTSAVASELSSIKTISLFSLVGALVAAAAILLMSMLMIVRERRREIGILKAFGSSNGGVVASFATEALTITLMSAVVGTVLGVLLANPVLGLLQRTQSTTPGRTFGFAGGPGFVSRFSGFGTSGLSNLHAVLGTNVVVDAVLLAVGVALLGSVVPSYVIAKVRPAEVMRSEG